MQLSRGHRHQPLNAAAPRSCQTLPDGIAAPQCPPFAVTAAAMPSPIVRDDALLSNSDWLLSGSGVVVWMVPLADI